MIGKELKLFGAEAKGLHGQLLLLWQRLVLYIPLSSLQPVEKIFLMALAVNFNMLIIPTPSMLIHELV